MKIYKKVSSRIFSTTNIKHNIFTVIARGKIINIEHNEDYSYLKLFIRNSAGLRHTYLTFRYDPKYFILVKTNM